MENKKKDEPKQQTPFVDQYRYQTYDTYIFEMTYGTLPDGHEAERYHNERNKKREAVETF